MKIHTKINSSLSYNRHKRAFSFRKNKLVHTVVTNWAFTLCNWSTGCKV